MKNKLLGIILVGVLFLGLTGCGAKITDYPGVYEQGDVKIKVYLEGDTFVYKVESPNITTRGESELEKNVIKLDNVSENSTFTFKSGKADLKTDYEFIKSGKYTRTGDYAKEDYYNDFYGEKAYLTSELNGIYVKDNLKIYVYQTNEGTIRMFYDLNGNTSDLEIYREEEKFALDFFEDVYNIKFESGKMIIDLKTDNEENKVLNGTYTKESTLTIDQIIETYQHN